jgi:dTDP-4-amino-4,6-dideoxygalactose transaminase
MVSFDCSSAERDERTFTDSPPGTIREKRIRRRINKRSSFMSSITTKMTTMHLPTDTNASGRNFGPEELELLRQVLESGTLNCTKGTFVTEFEKQFAEHLGALSACAVTSGTAAIHCAVVAVNPNPGDEIISSPITDMGAITPILYQGAVPVFADVDPVSLLLTAETIEPRITHRTRAIIVTHLFGNPCDMDPIMELARKHNLIVIEDCAQSYDATYKEKPVGTIGHIGCFSLQQGKHITTGEGGIVVTNDPQYARAVKLFHDKAWGYGDPNPDHYFLALNYRMTELQGAVAVAQLPKLPWSVNQRSSMAEMLTERLSGLEGVELPLATPGATHVYWKYAIRFPNDNVGEIAKLLRENYALATAPRYIQKPAFMCEVLRDRRTFGTSHWPYEGECRAGAKEPDCNPESFPGTLDGLAHVLVLPWNERYNETHVDYWSAAILDTIEQVRH